MGGPRGVKLFENFAAPCCTAAAPLCTEFYIRGNAIIWEAVGLFRHPLVVFLLETRADFGEFFR